jgi:hypothetical protein
VRRPAAATQPRRARDLNWLGAVLLLGMLEMVLLALWQRNGYWDFSDGVYAATARELLHGARLYHAVAAAQPPPVYLAGALLLAVHDGLAALRYGLALVDLATAGTVAWAVWRLCGVRRLALAAGLASPLLPIALHEHAQLTPETLAAPLVMLGALCCARQERSLLGGCLLALAAACKLAFVVPAVAVALVAVSVRRSLAGLIGAGITLSLAALLAYGGALWTETVAAQLDVGSASLHYIGGLLAQGAWNELPLIVGAAAALTTAGLRRGGGTAPLSDEAVGLGDAALLRTLAVAAASGLLLGLTLFKNGSYINVFVVAEPPLLALASYGVLLLWRRGALAGRLVVALLAALLAAQSASLLISPADPLIARRPGARAGLAEMSSPAAVSRAVTVARRCSPALAYSGVPYIAFLADRQMPGDQPDLFMLRYASADASFARRAAADEPRCPR